MDNLYLRWRAFRKKHPDSLSSMALKMGLSRYTLMKFNACKAIGDLSMMKIEKFMDTLEHSSI